MSKKILVALVFTFSVASVFSQSLADKANLFLNSLSKELRTACQLPLNDPERYNFNFVPLARKGPTFNDFDDKQKQLALDLLRSSLSEQGFSKTTEIMELEKVLIIVEKRAADDHYRDPLNYHFLVYGSPSDSKPWFWRFEGHHVSFSFSAAQGKIVSSTPSFFGSNPGKVSIELQKGKEVLKMETALGFELVNAFTPEQLAAVVFDKTAPAEIITGTKRKAELLEPKGIAYLKMTESQKQLFLKLLDTYIQNYELGFSKTLYSKIKSAGLDNLYFAWAGSMKPGIAQYYRIQGPTLLIEYDNTQNNANHVHTLVRDLTNDFAEDVLREHYQRDH